MDERNYERHCTFMPWLVEPIGVPCISMMKQVIEIDELILYLWFYELQMWYNYDGSKIPII